MRARAVNIKHEEFDVMVDRTSMFGNPFSHKPATGATWIVRDRATAIDLYRTWLVHRLRTDPKFRTEFSKLRGKRLGCSCLPLACHAEVIAEFLNDGYSVPLTPQRVDTKQWSIDVNIWAPSPINRLSNLYDRPFEFDGHVCHSIESFLQSLKTVDDELARALRIMPGPLAKREGKNVPWQFLQNLHWNGQTYDRHSRSYAELLMRLYSLVFETFEDYRQALRWTRDHQIMHSIGNSDPRVTILTANEFCAILNSLRKRL